jgi:hypothetical protein
MDMRKHSLTRICESILTEAEERMRTKRGEVEYIATPKEKELFIEVEKLFMKVANDAAKVEEFISAVKTWEKEVIGENFEEEIPFLQTEKDTDSKDGNSIGRPMETRNQSEGWVQMPRNTKRKIQV